MVTISTYIGEKLCLPLAVNQINHRETMRPRILVLPHDSHVACSVMTSLAFEYETLAGIPASGDAGQEAIKYNPNLILIDLSSMGGSGLTLCQHIRQRSQVPIMLMGSEPNYEMGIAALQVGADDFVTEYIHPIELSARIRTLLRRCYQPNASPMTYVAA